MKEFSQVFSVLINFYFSILCLLFLRILCFFLDFPDDATDYILEWAGEFEAFKDFSWVTLRDNLNWQTVKKSMDVISKRTSFNLSHNSSAVFDQCVYVKSFCTNEKLSEWEANKVPTEQRWVEIFKHMEAKHVPFDEFSKIIEYALCFPGSSAPVERVFATAKKIWKLESSSLQIATLNAILHVKMNMEWSCIEFYDFLKTKPDLLRQISGQDKYVVRQPMTVENMSSDAMSVELASVDEI